MIEIARQTYPDRDTLMRNLREVVGSIKDHERKILDLATRVAKMPRKDFIRAWEGNQVNLEWVDEVLKRKQKWSSALRDELWSAPMRRYMYRSSTSSRSVSIGRRCLAR